LFFCDGFCDGKKASRETFFLAPKKPGGYAARAKGEGEDKRRSVNNLLTVWVLNRVMPASNIDRPEFGFFCVHRSFLLGAGCVVGNGHFLPA
jgi:hypothetical protein